MQTLLQASKNNLEALLTTNNTFRIVQILVKNSLFLDNFQYFLGAETDKLQFLTRKTDKVDHEINFFENLRKFLIVLRY